MFRDLFDRLYLLTAVLLLLAIILFISGFIGTDSAGPEMKRDPSMERAMQEQARAAFLLEAYSPVESLVAAGRYTEALLKLQELGKAYPGEAHTSIMRGAILISQGVLGEGLSRYATAVQANGDYVDAKSSLNRRQEITELVESALPKLKTSLQQVTTPSLERSLKDAYYLQSRLAGGCE